MTHLIKWGYSHVEFLVGPKVKIFIFILFFERAYFCNVLLFNNMLTSVTSDVNDLNENITGKLLKLAKLRRILRDHPIYFQQGIVDKCFV